MARPRETHPDGLLGLSGMAELDRTRWIELLSRLGGRDPDLRQLAELQGAYSEAHRYYHNVTHLRGCLKLCDALRDHFRQPDEAELALWYHDAVYRTRSDHNEADSADWARRFCESSGIGAEAAARVAELILNTAHGEQSLEGDAALVCDIDLAILGFPAAAYDDFEQRIRREYHWVEEDQFIEARLAILRGFLSRAQIYRSAALRPVLEDSARANLRRWVERWSQRAATAPPLRQAI